MDIKNFIEAKVKLLNLNDIDKNKIINITKYKILQLPYFNNNFNFFFLSETIDGQIVLQNNTLHEKKGFINNTLSKQYYGFHHISKDKENSNEDYDEEDYYYEDEKPLPTIKKSYISKEDFLIIKKFIEKFEQSKSVKDFSEFFSDVAESKPEELVKFFYYIDSLNGFYHRSKIFNNFIYNSQGKISANQDSYYIGERKNNKNTFSFFKRKIGDIYIKPNELDEITNNTLNYRNLEDPNRILDPENFPYYNFTNFLEMNKQDFIKHKNQDSIEERKTMVKAYTLSTLGNIVFSNLSLSEKVIEISENYYQENKEKALTNIKNDFKKYTFDNISLDKKIKEESENLFTEIMEKYPELNKTPKENIEHLETIQKKYYFEDRHSSNEEVFKIVKENKLHLISENYSIERDSTYRNLGQFVKSFDKNFHKYLIYFRTKNSKDIVAGINCVFKDNKPDILIAPSTGVALNYRGLGIAEKLYRSFSEQLKKEEKIMFSSHYTTEGAQKLPRLKSRINNDNENIIFLNADPSGTHHLQEYEDKFMQNNNIIADLNQYLQNYLEKDEKPFDYYKFQKSYKKMIKYFKKEITNIEEKDYLRQFDLKEKTFKKFQEEYNKRPTNKIKAKA